MAAQDDGAATQPGLMVGPTSEFSLFFRVKDGQAPSLRTALLDLQNTPGYRPGDYNVAIATIHEARFVMFHDDTRLAFVTSFDGPWDAYMEDFFTSGPTLALFVAVFQHLEGYDGLPDLAAVRDFVLSSEVPAAAYARNYGGTVKELRKAQRVNAAFQQVLEAVKALGIEPGAAEVAMLPQNYVKLEGKTAQQMIKLIDLLEEHEDTKKVWSNADIEEKEIEASLA